MSDSVDLHLVILWEDELRAAARLLHRACDEKLTEEERDEAARAGYHAATVALWGLTDDHTCVLIGSGELNTRARRDGRRDSIEGKP